LPAVAVEQPFEFLIGAVEGVARDMHGLQKTAMNRVWMLRLRPVQDCRRCRWLRADPSGPSVSAPFAWRPRQ
jgi:hypothetical protein